MRRKLDNCVAVLIPRYNRPEMLEITLPGWFKAKYVEKIFLVAEASSRRTLETYKEVIGGYEKSDKITSRLTLKRLGSVKARNTLLDMATEYGCKFALMVDDDYLLLDEKCLGVMVRDLESHTQIGAVGGKVVVTRQRMDPDFFLNLPVNLADPLSRLIGYVFLDIERGPRWSEFLPHFFMIKGEVLDNLVRYDKIFDTPTGFREESDLQLQIRRMGYRLLFDPRVQVIHLAAGKGGDRPKMSMGKRMYWKARNHAYFLLKYFRGLRLFWYLLCGFLILLTYRPHSIIEIVRGYTHSLKST